MQELLYCIRNACHLRRPHLTKNRVKLVHVGGSLQSLLGGARPHKAKRSYAHGRWMCVQTSRYLWPSLQCGLMYKYTQRKCLAEVKEIYPLVKSFNSAVRLSLELPVYRTTHPRDLSIFNRNARFWNNSPAMVSAAVPADFQVEHSQTLFPLSTLLSL